MTDDMKELVEAAQAMIDVLGPGGYYPAAGSIKTQRLRAVLEKIGQGKDTEKAYLTSRSGQINKTALSLTSDEISFVLNELHAQGHGRGSSKDDYEAECPSCTAADKLAAALSASLPPESSPASASTGSEG